MSQMIHLFIICLLLIFSNSYAKSGSSVKCVDACRVERIALT